jgi:hypothetical protein
MKVSDQLHAPSDLPQQKQFSPSILYEIGCPANTLENKINSSLCWESNHAYSKL